MGTAQSIAFLAARGLIDPICLVDWSGQTQWSGVGKSYRTITEIRWRREFLRLGAGRGGLLVLVAAAALLLVRSLRSCLGLALGPTDAMDGRVGLLTLIDWFSVSGRRAVGRSNRRAAVRWCGVWRLRCRLLALSPTLPLRRFLPPPPHTPPPTAAAACCKHDDDGPASQCRKGESVRERMMPAAAAAAQAQANAAPNNNDPPPA